jgi:hypothetical protein
LGDGRVIIDAGLSDEVFSKLYYNKTFRMNPNYEYNDNPELVDPKAEISRTYVSKDPKNILPL